MLFLHSQGGLRRGVRASGSPQLRTGKSGSFNMGTSHGACLEFPREAGLILRGAVQAGNPFQTTQGNQLSCREQERSRCSEEVVLGLSVFPSREPSMSGNFWMSHEGCQVPHATCVQCELSAQGMAIPADPLNRHAPSTPGPWAGLGEGEMGVGGDAGAILLSGTCAIPHSSPLVIRKEFCCQGRLFFTKQRKSNLK